MHRFQQENPYERDVPLPGDEAEKKHVAVIGKQTFVFDDDEEMKDFYFLIRMKHIPPDDAYVHVENLKKKGRYGTVKRDMVDDDKDEPRDRRSPRDDDRDESIFNGGPIL